MKTIDTYISEKLHLTADNKGNLIKEPLYTMLHKVASRTVNDLLEHAFGIKGRLYTTEYITMIEDDKGNTVDDNPKNEDKIARLYFWSKEERFTKNINNIAKSVGEALDKIKEVKKVETFATSFVIYFKDYKSA